jgi:hypothetical protein
MAKLLLVQNMIMFKHITDKLGIGTQKICGNDNAENISFFDMQHFFWGSKLQ